MITRDDVIAASCLLIAGTINILFFTGSGLTDPWIFMTGPWCPRTSANPVLGYAFGFTNGEIIHNENTSLLTDVSMFAGQSINASFYALRPGTGLLAFLTAAFDPALSGMVHLLSNSRLPSF
jgi:hypothetical protein